MNYFIQLFKKKNLFLSIVILGSFASLSFRNNNLAVNSTIEEETLNKEFFISKWKVTQYTPHFKNLSTWVIEGGKEEALSTSYNINSDGSFTMKSNYFKEPAKGTWNFDSNKNQITFSMDSSPNSPYTIIKWESSKFEMRSKKSDIGYDEYELSKLD